MRTLFFLWVIQGYAAFNLTWAVPAVNLDSNPPVGDTDVNASLAIDASGNACTTWGRTTGNNAVQDIWAALYQHSPRTWTGAMKISGDGHAVHSQVAMDPEGNALFVWEEGFPSKIMYRTLASSGVWSPPLSSPPSCICKTMTPQTSPKLAMNEAGDAVVIWTEFTKESHQLCSSSKSSDGSWNAPCQISTGANDLSLAGAKSLAINSAGDAFAAWEEAGQIVFASYTNGLWSSPLQIESGRDPFVAIDAQGSGLVVWEQAGVIVSCQLIDGQLQAQQTVSDPNYQCRRPCVKVDQEGNAVIVFERSDLLHKFIAGATLPYGSAQWSTPNDISAPSLAATKEAGFPVLSLNAIGDGVVIWKEFDGRNMTIQGAGYSLGTWSFTKTLSAPSSHAAEHFPTYDIDVAVNLSGNILAIWPEDPMGNGAQQIKATVGIGLANKAPTPPLPDPLTIENGIASGFQESHFFPAHLDLINILLWSTNTPGAYYKIYRGNLSSLIGTSKTAHFEDHQRIPGQKETYLITSVDENEQESAPMTLIVHPK